MTSPGLTWVSDLVLLAFPLHLRIFLSFLCFPLFFSFYLSSFRRILIVFFLISTHFDPFFLFLAHFAISFLYSLLDYFYIIVLSILFLFLFSLISFFSLVFLDFAFILFSFYCFLLSFILFVRFFFSSCLTSYLFCLLYPFLRVYSLFLCYYRIRRAFFISKSGKKIVTSNIILSYEVRVQRFFPLFKYLSTY